MTSLARRAYALTAIALVTGLVVAPSAARSQYDCPHEWRDAGVPIADPQPAAPVGVPEAEIDALHAFATDAGISSLEGLLGALPTWLLANHILVEATRSGNPASVEHPRVLLFGSDARFLMAFGSDPDDPGREVIDIAELEDSGFWKFRSIDFGTSPPTLSPDDSACTGCHADPPRPFWGSYPNWPGMFGPQQDRVTAAQANRLNELRANPSASDRFFALGVPAPFGGGVWEEGDVVRLPGRSYAYSNTVFNMELGAAVADGAFRRLRASPPSGICATSSSRSRTALPATASRMRARAPATPFQPRCSPSASPRQPGIPSIATWAWIPIGRSLSTDSPTSHRIRTGTSPPIPSRVW